MADICDIGCVDMVLSTPDKQFEYMLGNADGPLDRIIKAIIWLLIDKSNFELSYFNAFGDYAWTDEFLDNDGFIWVLKYDQDSLKLLIWENSNYDDLGAMCQNDFDKATYRFYGTGEEDDNYLPDLNRNLLFALEGDPVHFVKTMINAINNADNRFNHKAQSGEYGFNCNKSEIALLENWLRNKTTRSAF